MTTTATAPACPKCGGGMWDQKNGKFPWKPGTPIFKCKTKECATNGGVIWEPKNGAIPPTAAPPKSAPAKLPISHSNVPDSALPLELSDEAEVMLESYLTLTDWVLKRLPPIYEKAGIGMSPESAAASVHTLFIEANKRRVR